MAQVLGIGGFFYKAADPAATRDWYSRVLGFEFTSWGGVAFEASDMAKIPGAATAWSVSNLTSDNFAPSTRDFMINLLVDDLDGLLARIEKEGVEIISKTLDDPFGRFAQIMDLDGIKIELWEPKAEDA
jgi:predicted enzyme related to lactoylglutathione lyase